MQQRGQSTTAGMEILHTTMPPPPFGIEKTVITKTNTTTTTTNASIYI
jgi:hypothetical protein